MAGNEQIPAEAAWGTQTQLAIANFPISGRPVDARLLRAIARIKAAAAAVNGALTEVPGGERIAKLIYDMSRHQGIDVTAVRVWETPTSFASYSE